MSFTFSFLLGNQYPDVSNLTRGTGSGGRSSSKQEDAGSLCSGFFSPGCPFLFRLTPVPLVFVENPIRRYKLGTDTPGMKKRADGSFDVPLQFEKPDGEFAANWLPTPKGPFYVILRLYIPREELLTGQYALPQIEVEK